MISKRQKRRNRWRSRLTKPEPPRVTISLSVGMEVISRAFEIVKDSIMQFSKALQSLNERLVEEFSSVHLSLSSGFTSIAIKPPVLYRGFCNGCKYATHEALLPCAVHPIFPEYDCSDWEAIA